MRDRPRLLDLFCGAGGASMGYHRAGFDVVGVDINPQPHYPFEFHRADALEFPLDGFDVIHASPPCQAFSTLAARWENAADHPDLIDATRDRLNGTGRPWVMENVRGAGLRATLMLCGSGFGLGANGRQLRRHRYFEFPPSVIVMGLPCAHRGQPVGVYGQGGGGQQTRGYKGNAEEYRQAMGIDWATKAEIAEAIPPAYTELIGRQVLEQIPGVERERPTPHGPTPGVKNLHNAGR